jgi:hypothetical protein
MYYAAGKRVKAKDREKSGFLKPEHADKAADLKGQVKPDRFSLTELVPWSLVPVPCHV